MQQLRRAQGTGAAAAVPLGRQEGVLRVPLIDVLVQPIRSALRAQPARPADRKAAAMFASQCRESAARAQLMWDLLRLLRLREVQRTFQ